MENIWAKFIHGYEAKRLVHLKEFKTFENKSRAINLGSGVNRQLTEMIVKWRHRGEKLAVGKPEYKRIIQKSLCIPCLCDDAVMELMWGMKNLMHILVPQEKSELTTEDRLPMSQGLMKFLCRYGFINVKPEKVNKQIVLAASILYDFESYEKKNLVFLRTTALPLKVISGIDYEDWDFVKLATALKMICFPRENVAGDPRKMFTKDELSKLKRDAHKYKHEFDKFECMRFYEAVVVAYEDKKRKVQELGSLIKEAMEAKQRRNVKLNNQGVKVDVEAEQRSNVQLKKRKRTVQEAEAHEDEQ